MLVVSVLRVVAGFFGGGSFFFVFLLDVGDGHRCSSNCIGLSGEVIDEESASLDVCWGRQRTKSGTLSENGQGFSPRGLWGGGLSSGANYY